MRGWRMRHVKLTLISLLIIYFLNGFSITFAQQTTQKKITPKDTTKKDTAKVIPGLYKHVDVKIFYSWKPEEPDVYHNVRCQLIKKKGTVTTLWIYLPKFKEEVDVKKNLITYEIWDARTKKLLAKGP